MIAPPIPLAPSQSSPDLPAAPTDAARYSLESENLLTLAHIYTATAALALGAIFGLLQSFSRANWIVVPAWFDYYRMLTAHGVLMALVFTTFFITGLMTYATYRAIPKIRSVRLGWAGYLTMLVGTLTVFGTIVTGNATVLYTFYAPMKAHPLFYIGATVLVAGTWLVSADIFRQVAWHQRTHPGERIPLPAFISATTFIMWDIATIGVALEMALLIPWSLGITPGIDVELTRMLFWYFGHPLVYFWIMGAYLIWYTVVPTTFGGKVFSDSLTRLAFITLLLLSTPVGLHHQFLDPGISAGWKYVHMLTTYGVVIPSLMTAFAIFASFELAARKAGKRGFLATVRWLPWGDPVFAGPALGMILFLFGGFGGIVNSSYSMDVLVHNTMWIVGHFHITVGGPVALSFMGVAYRLVPALTGRKLFAPKLALAQTYLWFVGMALMSTAMHVSGLLGAPRRTADVTYAGTPGVPAWHLEMTLTAVGGSILFVSIIAFVIVAVGTRLRDTTDEPRVAWVTAPPDPSAMPTPPVFDQLGRWAIAALALALLAYAGPVHDQLSQRHYLAPGMRTW
jgi:cytochrome c oxidase subunit 1